jgi:lipoprotein-anchoring transpeptidase ErfK/SrfK
LFTAVASAALAVLLAAAGPAAAVGPGRSVVRILDDAALHAAPAGRAVFDAGGHLAHEHGSAWVLQRRGPWLQIPTLQRRDGGRGWIRRTALRRVTTTRLIVRVDVSDRRVRVYHGSRLLLSEPVGVGAPSSPSPIGATSVSERIAVTPVSSLSSSGYGPVVIALRMWQRLPSLSDPGGLMAFHGTDDPASVGTATSAGCFRMRNADVRRLARLVQPGTPVIVSR